MSFRIDSSRKWSITDPTLGARSIEENIKISKLPKSRRSFGVNHPPLFTTIPLSRVVIDMFLRIANTLINLLILELRRLDALEKVRKFATFDLSKAKFLVRWEAFLTSIAIRNAQSFFMLIKTQMENTNRARETAHITKH